jgi:ATP-dependent DNA helicase PIF1
MDELDAHQQDIIRLVVNGGVNAFVTGAGGVGKSKTISEMVKQLIAKGKRVVVIAPTGVAALNVKGKTIHAWAKIRLGKDPAADYIARAVKYRGRRPVRKFECDDAMARFINTDVLIFDEISMVSAGLFAKIDVMARELRLPRGIPTYGLRQYILERINEPGTPFGGMQVVVCGDFFQLPPVDDNSDRDFPKCWRCGGAGHVEDADERIYKCTVCATIFCGKARYSFQADPEGRNRWKECNFVFCELTKVHRQKDSEFVKMLNRFRLGNVLPEDIATLSSLSRSLPTTPNGMQPTKLLSTNEEVNAVNSVNYMRCRGKEYIYNMHKSSVGKYGEKLLDNAVRNSPFEVRVRLKVGAQVMLRFNLSLDHGLCNGTCGVVTGFVDVSDPEALKECGANTMGLGAAMMPRFGTVFPIISFKITGEKEPFVTIIGPQEINDEDTYGGVTSSVRIIQIPVNLAWGITIHKSQGMTLPYVRMNLSRCFDKGQAYVALARAASMDGLQVEAFDPHRIFCDEEVVEFYDECRGDGMKE